MSLRDRIYQYKEQSSNPTRNERNPGQIQDSQNMEQPYNPYQKQLEIDHNQNNFGEDGPLGKFKDSINPLEMLGQEFDAEPESEKELEGDDNQDDEEEKFQARIDRYKNRRDYNQRNNYNFEEGRKPEYQFNGIPGLYSSTNRFKHLLGANADKINKVPSYDGISPLLNTPDYRSDWSYSYHINNNIPFTKRKRFKKKRKDGVISQNQTSTKVAFTAPSGTFPSFSDIKNPSNQLLSIFSSNFNATEKFMKEQQEYNKRIAKTIDDLEKEIKNLKKK